MIQIDKTLLDELFAKAEASERRRMNYDLRTSAEDKSQRMLNALLPGTCVPVHRHPMSNENVILLCGKLVEILYEEVLNGSESSESSEGSNSSSQSSGASGANGVELREIERYILDPSVGNFGCVVPAGVWHTVEVVEPSVIYEAKDGAYGKDGSETLSEFQNVSKPTAVSEGFKSLKEQITYLIGMERHSGSMEVITPLYVSRMLNVPIEEVEKVMREMCI